MSFATLAIAGAVSAACGVIRDAQERQRLGLPPLKPEPAPEPVSRRADDTSSLFTAGMFGLGYAMGSGSSHSHHTSTTSPSYDSGSSTPSPAPDTFSSGGGGDYGGGGATGDF